MDIFSMLQNAPIVDAENDELVGQAVGFEVINGRMKIRVIFFDDEEEGPDDGVKDPIPENQVVPLRAVGGDKLV